MSRDALSHRYGGHITDAWDRRTNNTYLSVLFTPAILTRGKLAPGLSVPDMDTNNYDTVAEYIHNGLPKEGPPAFGLHANAEIGYLTQTADSLLQNVLSFVGPSASSSDAAHPPPKGATAPAPTPGGGIRDILNNLLERLPEDFPMLDIEARAELFLAPSSGKAATASSTAAQGTAAPFVLVCMQVCSVSHAVGGHVLRERIRRRLYAT